MRERQQQKAARQTMTASSRQPERQAGQRRTSSDSRQQNKLLGIFCHAHIKVKILYAQKRP